MENIWSLLCTKAIVDERTKLVSLIETMDAIDVEGDLPAVDPKTPVAIGPTSIYIASFWYRSDIDKPEKSKCRHTLVGPDGQRFEQQEVEVDLQNSTSSHIVVFVPALQYVGLGRYYVLVEKMDQGEGVWSTVRRLPLLLRTKTKKP